MIFVDTNVFMYAVGRPHPLQSAAQDFFAESADNHLRLFTSAEVLQELFHVYEATGRMDTLAVAMELVDKSIAEVWPLEREDVGLARQNARAASYAGCAGPVPPGELPEARDKASKDL